MMKVLECVKYPWERELWDEITIAYGVFKEDIELATPRLIEYIYALEHKNRAH